MCTTAVAIKLYILIDRSSRDSDLCLLNAGKMVSPTAWATKALALEYITCELACAISQVIFMSGITAICTLTTVIKITRAASLVSSHTKYRV